jgi:hypothetical protein
MDDRAPIHDDTSVAGGKRKVEILFDQHDRQSQFARQVRKQICDEVDHHRRNTVRRFVHEQDIGFRAQGASDGKHLLLTSGHGPAPLIETLSQDRKVRENFLVDACSPIAPCAGAELKIFLHGQARKYSSPLGNVSNPNPRNAMRRQTRNFRLSDSNGA